MWLFGDIHVSDSTWKLWCLFLSQVMLISPLLLIHLFTSGYNDLLSGNVADWFPGSHSRSSRLCML